MYISYIHVKIRYFCWDPRCAARGRILAGRNLPKLCSEESLFFIPSHIKATANGKHVLLGGFLKDYKRCPYIDSAIKNYI